MPRILLPLALALVVAVALPTHGHEDSWDRFIPTERVFARFNQIRKILVPVPEESLEEGLYHLGSYYIPIDSETDLCKNHSSYYFERFLKKDMWAIRMVDSASKIPAGVLDGHIMDLGSYDECLTVKEPGGMFQGQFCLVETKGVLPEDLVKPLNPERPFLETIRSDLAFVVCVPSSCTARDVKAHMDVALNSVNASAIVYPHSCSSRIPDPYTFGDWFALFMIMLIAVCTVLSTIYDNRCKESEKSRLLSAFSLSSNIHQMVNTSTTTAAITSMNGLRVLAMFWVIIGHRMLHCLAFPSHRLRHVAEKIDYLAMAPIENTQLAVEIFFLMSGVLVSYGYLRYRHNGKQVNILHFYLNRYFRLTPALAAMALLQATLFIRITDGPLWTRFFHSFQENCQLYWWSTLLYVSNYANPYNMCVPQTWYLSSDFQLYFFSPLVLIPLFRRPRLGLTLIAVLATLTTAGGLWNAYSEGLRAGGPVTLDRRTEEAHTKDYILTHFRAFSFLLGLALGYLLYRIKQGQLILKLSRWMLWTGWTASVCFILFSVFFANYFMKPDYEYYPVLESLYLVLHRHMLAIGFSWIILVCTLGYGGAVDKFLSWRAWIPLARLTYCAYLTHIFVQSSQMYSQRVTLSLHHIYVLYFFSASDLVISYLSAALLFLAVEAPAANIVAWIFRGNRKSEEEQEAQNHTQIQLPVFKENSSSS